RTGVGGIAVVGVRLGGTVAAWAVDEQLEIDALVLWDALSTGDEWLREERTYHLLARQVPAERAGPPPTDGGEELAGFLLAGDMVDELHHVDLASRVPPPAWPADLPVLLIEGPRRHRRSLGEPLRARGAHVESQDVPGLAEMLEEAERAEPPTLAVEAIADWLSARRPLHARDRVPESEPSSVLEDAGVCEQAFTVDGEAGRLFGVICEPAERPDEAREWVVLLNAGFVRHIGPNRLYVQWAREWARRGLPSLRLDGRSVGESDGSDGPHRSVTELYSADAVADAAALVDALAERRGAETLTLVGLCSGAYMAFHLALRTPAVKRIVLLNPQILSYDKESSERGQASYVRRSLLSPTKWRSMLARRSAWRQLGDRLALLARTGIAAARRRVRRSPAEGAAGDWLVTALSTLRDQGTDVQFVMSESDPGLGYLARHLGPELSEAPLELQLVRDADHTFRTLDAQRRLTAIMDELVAGERERVAG